MPHSPPRVSHPPSAGYYSKFGGSLAAIRSKRGVAWDVDELSTISAKSWKNNGQRADNRGDPVWALIEAKDPHFPPRVSHPAGHRILP